MNEFVHAVIQDDVSVQIGGIAFQERSELIAAFHRVLADNPDAILSIEAERTSFFRAIGKAIYAAHFAGFSPQNIHVTAEGKRIEPQP